MNWLLRRAKTIFGSCFGPLIESYDFFCWFLLSGQIAEVLLPNQTSRFHECFTISTFGATFAIRAVGAFIFGYIGDRHSRVNALKIATALVGVGGVFYGCLPVWDKNHSIRNTALACIIRAFQALSYGALVSGAATYLTERSQEFSHNKMTALSLVASNVGILLSVCVVGTMKQYLSDDDIVSWAWRIPFLAEIILVVVANVLQNQMKMSDDFNHLLNHSLISFNPITDVFLESFWDVLVMVLVLAPYFTTYAFVIFFLPWYATNTLEQSSKNAANCMVLAVVSHMIAVYFGASMADRIGHVKTTYYSCIAYIVLIIPTFQMLLTFPSDEMVYQVCVFIISAINGFGAGGIQVLCFTLFNDVWRRHTSIAISWNISFFIFAGGSMLLNIYGVKHSALLPAYIITLSAFGCLMLCHYYFRQVSSEINLVKKATMQETKVSQHFENLNQSFYVVRRQRATDVMTLQERSSKTCQKRLKTLEDRLHNDERHTVRDEVYDPDCTDREHLYEQMRNTYQVHHIPSHGLELKLTEGAKLQAPPNVNRENSLSAENIFQTFVEANESASKHSNGSDV